MDTNLEVMRALGRIEGRIEGLYDLDKRNVSRMNLLEEKVESLEGAANLTRGKLTVIVALIGAASGAAASLLKGLV